MKNNIATSPFASLESIKESLPTASQDTVEPLKTKKQPREKIITAIDAALVNKGLSHTMAAQARQLLLEAFAKEYGGFPNHSGMIANNLNHPAAQGIIKQTLEEQANAESARAKAAQAEQPTQQEEAKTSPMVWKTPTANSLPAEDEEKLHSALLEAVQSGSKSKVDAVLKALVTYCISKQQDYFVTQFRNHTKVSSMLIGRLLTNNLRFGLYWTENGMGSEVLPMPKAAKAAPKGLPESEQKRLTTLLVAAVDDEGTSDDMREALEEIISTCRKYGAQSFTTPYQNFTKESGIIMRFLMERDDRKFGFYWTEDGLGTPLDQLGKSTVPPQQRKGRPKEAQARRNERILRDTAERNAKKTPSNGKQKSFRQK